tara:strand:- start:32 stop:1381 length:1350 start_codon:yes stop_codon:yes gene_type:complete
MTLDLKKYINSYRDSSPLAVFRILFGVLMFFSIVRFWYNGWIETVYIEPLLHFKYYGFEWVKSLNEWNYLLFALCAVTSILIAIGYKYKISIILFFLSFTYIELIDKTTYLNHYYFVSIISFILIFVPANCKFSVDSFRNKIEYEKVPIWTIDVIKVMLFIVYFYAGLAKINSDWLIRAMPLSIWLPGKYDLPIIGFLMDQKWVAYAMSWCGMLYDLLIGFFLFSKKYRNVAFLFVVIFHLMTAVFFPSIGMFPYIMITSTIIFLNQKVHLNIIKYLKKIFFVKTNNKILSTYNTKNISVYILSVLLLIQILFPLRCLLYSGELFWNEEGYRFSWRVMLMEKAGHTTFTVIDKNSDKRIMVQNDKFLTTFQEKQMSFQPDMILEYAHFLGDFYKKKGFAKPSVFADSYVTLNKRISTRFIEKDFDLLSTKNSFLKKKWIIPIKDEIKGF